MAKGKGVGAKGKLVATSSGGGRSPASKSIHAGGSEAQKAVHAGSKGVAVGKRSSAAASAITKSNTKGLPQGRGQNR
jgi:hypothetical protein